MNDPGLALKALLTALDQCGIAYLIGGSMASGIHGIYRTSMDVDLAADIHQAQVAGLAERLRDEFYVEGDVTLIHLGSSFKFGILQLSSDVYEQMRFSRRTLCKVVVGGGSVSMSVATAEDTLLTTIVDYRTGGERSECQWNDVLGIRAVQADSLDRAYLTQWAGYLKVTDLLEEALSA